MRALRPDQMMSAGDEWTRIVLSPSLGETISKGRRLGSEEFALLVALLLIAVFAHGSALFLR